MLSPPHRSYPVADRSDGLMVKHDVRLLATQLGFSAKKMVEIDLIVAELTSNLVKYAKDGEILVRPVPQAIHAGLELISVDSGPGMNDPSRMLRDGVSTGGSLGQGLGAIGRLSDLFQLYSLPGRGTVALVRVFPAPAVPETNRPPAAVGAVIVPKPGETACGDAVFARLTTTSLGLFLGDGLGHGLPAQQAVQRAVATLEQQPAGSPAVWLEAMHRAATGTRGLVGTGAVFEFATRRWKLCGVGNVRALVSGAHQTKSYQGPNGILGYNLPRTLLDNERPYEPGQCLVLASDGLQTRWKPAQYPGAGRHDPAVLAAAIYKENTYRTDDASVVVARID